MVRTIYTILPEYYILNYIYNIKKVIEKTHKEYKLFTTTGYLTQNLFMWNK